MPAEIELSGFLQAALSRRRFVVVLAGGTAAVLGACAPQAPAPTPTAAVPTSSPSSPGPVVSPGAAASAAASPAAASSPSPAAQPGLAPSPSPGVSAIAVASPSPASTGLQRIMRNQSPLLLETPVDQLSGPITPNELHFVRQHFDIPTTDAPSWRLRVEGKVSKPLTLSLDQLRALPSRTLTAFIECSGNSRSQFTPRTAGTQWGNGAISVAEWTGVSLSTVLDMAGLAADATSIVGEGADSGKVYRAVPRDKALDPDTLVAYAQNGQPITRENGFPLRLVVPGWGGINSIKWLARLRAVDASFRGFYNDRYYVYETPGLPKKPVQAMGVKSFVTSPTKDAQLAAGTAVMLRGFAYSGLDQVDRVDVSTDDGKTWQSARLLEPNTRWSWVRWEYSWSPSGAGAAVIRSRATDKAGNAQPETVAWNRYGYGYNAIQATPITIG